MIVYCIYKNPKDYPGMFVVRRWNGLIPDSQPLIISSNYIYAKNIIPKRFIKIDRQPTDDIAILESYI